MPTSWLSLFALGVTGGLGLALLGWLVRSELRARRRARATAQLAARYRREPPAASASRSAAADLPSQKVTVNDLIARIQAEDSPVRLNWDDDGQSRPAGEDWPTGVLPRLPRSSP